jgi:hypothetical protein
MVERVLTLRELNRATLCYSVVLPKRGESKSLREEQSYVEIPASTSSTR